MIDTINAFKKQMGILVPITILLIFIVVMFKLELSKQESLEKIEKENKPCQKKSLFCLKQVKQDAQR